MEGRALLLCPVRLNEGIVHIDAEIPDGALYLRVAQ
jgi:hypothetical protein